MATQWGARARRWVPANWPSKVEPDPERWERIGSEYRLKTARKPGPNSNTLVTDILWLASAEFGRQRAAGFVMQPSDLDGPLAKMWAPK